MRQSGINHHEILQPVRLAAGNEPYAVSLSADGGLLAVVARLARPVPPAVVPASEVTLVDARAGRVLDRRSLASAHLSEGVAIASDGSPGSVEEMRSDSYRATNQVPDGVTEMRDTLAGQRAES